MKSMLALAAIGFVGIALSISVMVLFSACPPGSARIFGHCEVVHPE